MNVHLVLEKLGVYKNYNVNPDMIILERLLAMVMQLQQFRVRKFMQSASEHLLAVLLTEAIGPAAASDPKGNGKVRSWEKASNWQINKKYLGRFIKKI